MTRPPGEDITTSMCDHHHNTHHHCLLQRCLQHQRNCSVAPLSLVNGDLCSYQHFIMNKPEIRMMKYNVFFLIKIFIISKLFRSDGSSFSEKDVIRGPADDIIPQERIYCYSSDEEDSTKTTLPLQQRIRRSRFVSRIQEERIEIKDKLDMEQFQPMMTSEKLEVNRHNKRSSQIELRPRQSRRCKREAAPVSAEDYEDTARYLRKRNRKENDLGSLSTLGSELLKLDLIEPNSSIEVKYIYCKSLIIYVDCFSLNSEILIAPAANY